MPPTGSWRCLPIWPRRGHGVLVISHDLVRLVRIAENGLVVLRNGIPVETAPSAAFSGDGAGAGRSGLRGNCGGSNRAQSVLLIANGGIRHRYGDAEVLAGVDLAIAPGEVVGLGGLVGGRKDDAGSDSWPAWCDPMPGAVTLDGAPLLPALRRRVSRCPCNMHRNRRNWPWIHAGRSGVCWPTANRPRPSVCQALRYSQRLG